MKKGTKLLVVLVLVLAGATLAYAGAAPEGYQGVSDVARDPSAFEGKSRVERHRLVNALLEDAFKRGLHALALRARTPAEAA